jgi:hypothetical protein
VNKEGGRRAAKRVRLDNPDDTVSDESGEFRRADSKRTRLSDMSNLVNRKYLILASKNPEII